MGRRFSTASAAIKENPRSVRPASQPKEIWFPGLGRDQHAPVERHAGSGFDQSCQNKTKSENQGDAVVGAAKANEGVGRESESDQAAGHLQIRVEQWVSDIAGRMQDQGRRGKPAADRPKKDETKIMNPCPKTAPMTHKAPKWPTLPSEMQCKRDGRTGGVVLVLDKWLLIIYHLRKFKARRFLVAEPSARRRWVETLQLEMATT